MKNNTETIDPDVLDEIDLETLMNDQKQIIIYDDNINSFQHVISCLIKYCKHHSNQAEQCANIIHYNGKCSVKVGEYNDLKPIHEALLENGLNSKIE